MTRSALPHNYHVDEGEEIESFQVLGDWTIGGTAITKALSLDTIHFKSGTQSLKMSSDEGTITATKTVSIDLAGKDEMAIWIYVEDAVPSASITSIMMGLANDSEWKKWVGYSFAGTTLEHGWNVLKYGRANAAFSGFDFGQPVVRMRFTIYVASGQTTSVSICRFKAGIKTIPKILLTFDDGTAEQYTDAFEYMISKGLRGTLYLISNYLDAPGKITTAQCQAIYDAGFDICNHSKDHQYSLLEGSYAEQEAEYTYARDFLVAHGWSRGANHVAYPGNKMTSDTLDIMAAIGAKTARRVRFAPYMNSDDTLFMLPGMAPASLSIICSYIDRVIRNGETLFIMIHDPDDLSGGVATFTAMVDYLLTKNVDIVTISEWYNGLTNPRYRSLPVGRT